VGEPARDLIRGVGDGLRQRKGDRLRRITIGMGVGLVAGITLGAGPALAAGWTAVSIPPTGQDAFVLSVTADSGSDAWAVGSVSRGTGIEPAPLIDRWNGTAWRQAAAPVYPTNELVNLDAASASGPSDAWAAGYTRLGGQGQSFPTTDHWNGTSWTVVPAASITIGGQPVSNYLLDVTDVAPGDAWAVDECVPEDTGFVEHWNGTAWSVVTAPVPGRYGTSLSAISASSANDVWAVGDYLLRSGTSTDRYETYALHWNGTSWALLRMPKVASKNQLMAYQFNSIDAISPDNVWAVGDRGINVTTIGTPAKTLIEHWNGKAWSIVPSPSPGTMPFLNGVTATGASNVWAVGYDTPPGAAQPQTLTMHWNGTAWATVPSPHAGSASRLISAAAAPGGGGIWAVGYSGTTGSFDPLALKTAG
jgi:hypothetical protein